MNHTSTAPRQSTTRNTDRLTLPLTMVSEHCLTPREFADVLAGFSSHDAQFRAHISDCEKCAVEFELMKRSFESWEGDSTRDSVAALRQKLASRIEQESAECKRHPFPNTLRNRETTPDEADMRRVTLDHIRNAIGNLLKKVTLERVLAFAVAVEITAMTINSHDVLAALSALSLLALVVGVHEVMRHSPSLAGRMFAGRMEVTATFTMVMLTLGSVSLLAGQSVIREHTFAEVATFALLGVFGGVILRFAIAHTFWQMIRGNQTRNTQAGTLLLLGAMIAAIPASVPHRSMLALHLCGLATGAFLYSAIRKQESTRAQQQRRFQTISRYVSRSGETLSVLDTKAIKAFAVQDASTLRSFFRKHAEHSTAVVLMRAALDRIAGQYEHALILLREEAKHPDLDPRLANLIYLQIALNLGETTVDDDAMADALRVAESLHPDCVLTLTTSALRLAEDVPLESLVSPDDERQRSDQQSALAAIWRALDLNERRAPERLLAIVTGATVPVTWTFLLDAYAYVSLKCGKIRLARTLLLQCIREDPAFSSAHLHIGEWYYLQSLRTRVSTADNRAMEHWNHHAALSASIAIALEGKRDSRVKKRARHLYKLIAGLHPDPAKTDTKFMTLSHSLSK